MKTTNTTSSAKYPERVEQKKRNLISRMLVSEKFKEPAVETEFGLHPRVSVLLLFSAVVLAIFAALLSDHRTHQVFALLQGMIFGLLFSPQMRVWYRRSNATKEPTSQKDDAPIGGLPSISIPAPTTTSDS